MPQVQDVELRRSSLKGVLVGVLALLVLGLVVGIVVWIFHKSPAVPRPTTSTVLTEAQGLSFDNKYDQAITLLQSQLPYAKNNSERVKIYLAMGAAQGNKGDLKDALSSNMSAAALQPTFAILQSVGDIAAQLGDKQIAVTYYKEAEAILTSGKDKQDYGWLSTIQYDIQQQGGTP